MKETATLNVYGKEGRTETVVLGECSIQERIGPVWFRKVQLGFFLRRMLGTQYGPVRTRFI